MRTAFIALIFATALIFSASANVPEIFNDIYQFGEGVVDGLGLPAQDPDVVICRDRVVDTLNTAEALVQSVQNNDIAGLSADLNIIGANLSQAVLNCANATTVGQQIAENFVAKIKSLNSGAVLGNILGNFQPIQTDLHDITGYFTNKQFYYAGVDAADITNRIVFGTSNVSAFLPSNTETNTTATTTRRLLEEMTVDDNGTVVIKNTTTLKSVITEILDVITVIEGFLEVANTTLSVNDYMNCFNDAALFFVDLPRVEQAFASGNISTIALALAAVLEEFGLTTIDCNVVFNDIVAWVKRDLPYFLDAQRIEQAIKILNRDIPDTLDNIAEIIREGQYHNLEYLGRAIGTFYNQFYYALIQ